MKRGKTEIELSAKFLFFFRVKTLEDLIQYYSEANETKCSWFIKKS